MANNLSTVFQRLQHTIVGNTLKPITNSYQIKHNQVIDTASSPEEYRMKILQGKQQRLLAKQWVKANNDLANQTLAGLNDIKLMYRDSELMDGFPEIGTALDIFSEETTYINDSGFMVNITSKSDRIKSILTDLFVNRLSINVILPMICRSMCKYGNTFMLLNIDKDNGIMGWKQLPVYEMERYENGTQYPYQSAPHVSLNNVDETKTEDTKFVWVGQSEYIPYRSWQIAHFRLLYDSQFLPYGVSILHKARRHFRMLSMMEDMMLLYRLDRSVERRVFKVNVGAIDVNDVPAYVQEIANNFKRTPFIDPMTGQLDLRKNIMPVWKKTPIPLLDGRTITIEELAKEYEKGKTNYVYSIQDDTLQIVPGKVVWCGKNYTPNKMVKITLDDDTYMVMAPEHEIVMRDGTKKRADKVIVGETVMPFYKEDKVFNEHLQNKYDSNNDKKITNIEYIDGDDVYCMTVQGLNGEDDRHNFALRTFQEDGTWCDNGCFVSNCNTEDFFIPVRDSSEPNPIETLPAGQNLTAMDDIKFIQNKLFTALRVPKSFLNFEETSGDGKNLSLMDVRFTRTVNRIQQALLMELNKIAMIHLFLLGFTDELTNFNLTMNNPSSQAEMLELENLAKKITTAKDAVSDPGGGIPLTSMTWAWKHIMKWSDKEIQRNLEEIRLENALAAEIAKTSQIIRRTRIFDTVDNIYGEIDADYSDESAGNGEGGGPASGGGGGGMPIGGGDMDFGDGGDMGGEDIADGTEGEMSMEDNTTEDNAPSSEDNGPIPNIQDSIMRSLNILKEEKRQKLNKEMNLKRSNYAKILSERLTQKTINESLKRSEKNNISNKIFSLNEEMTDMIGRLTNYINNE